jgi:DNA topoisomerase-1
MSKKTLVIVESPHKGHTIQEILGKNYLVLASKGHIAELAQSGKHNLGVDVDNNFKPHYVLMKDKVETLQQILDAAKDASEILLCPDKDREGEAIAWHLAQRLDGINVPIKRISSNEITKKGLNKAIKNPREIDMNIVHAQEARRILDRLVGYLTSPFLMNTFGNNLSAGRVQSVLTRLIIEREKEIDSFVPEDFWTIQLLLSHDGKSSFTMKHASRLTNLVSATTARDAYQNAPHLVISSVFAQEEKKQPSPPLITSSVQRLMSRAFGFDADQTMKAAQKLYENGMITYLRTDSVRASDEAISEVREYLSNNSLPAPNKPNVFKNKDAAQDAHECIRPTDLSLLPGDPLITGKDEAVLYEAIWRHFVASQMPPAIFDTLKITAHIPGNKQMEVKASGKALKSPGFLQILGISDDSKIDLPNLKPGDIVKLFGENPIIFDKKQTQPPPRYSQDKLIKELEDRNIGRPATYAELLNKICSRNYVSKEGNVYHGTPLGKKITDVLSKHFKFMEFSYTAEMEEKLDKIANGSLDSISMLQEFYPLFKQELDRAYLANGGTLCPNCSSPIVSRTAKATGKKFLSCSAYPQCRFIKNLDD